MKARSVSTHQGARALNDLSNSWVGVQFAAGCVGGMLEREVRQQLAALRSLWRAPSLAALTPRGRWLVLTTPLQHHLLGKD